MADGFLVERHDAVFNVTIDRPDKDNTLTDEMLAELADLIDGAGKDEAIKAVALRGAGTEFSHGRDRTPGPEGRPANAYERHQWVIGRILGVYAAFRACPVPIVAVVQGRALGFGCALVAGSDIAIASRSATFALPEMLHGIPPTLAISAHAKVAAKTVADLVFSAEEIGAEHALAAGLVSRIIDDNALDAATDRPGHHRGVRAYRYRRREALYCERPEARSGYRVRPRRLHHGDDHVARQRLTGEGTDERQARDISR